MYVGGNTAVASSVESFGQADMSPPDCGSALLSRPEQIKTHHVMKSSSTGIFFCGFIAQVKLLNTLLV
jgi:hypothetical protein